MKATLLLLVVLALCAGGCVNCQGAEDDEIPRFILPWDVPKDIAIRALLGPKCVDYDFFTEHTVDEVQVYVIQARVSVPT
jgi:hypothetical protein